MAVIGDCVDRDAVVADLMCGTGSVAAALRQNGYRVVAADMMTFAYLHARVRLTFARAPRFSVFGGYERVIELLNSLEPTPGYYHREYSPAGTPKADVAPRGYFTAANAGRLDAITVTLRRWRNEGALSEPEDVLLRHDLVLAANRIANIAGTFGHFRSKWSSSSTAVLSLIPSDFSGRASTNHIVMQGRVEALASQVTADLCYLDPPYTKRQYAANYHLPETIARGDEPPAVGISGLRPWRDQYSDFCSKLRVRDSLRTVITTIDCPRILLSYSEDGLLSRADMQAFLSEFGDVEVIEIRGKRFRSQRESSASRDVTEFVFDLRRV